MQARDTARCRAAVRMAKGDRVKKYILSDDLSSVQSDKRVQHATQTPQDFLLQALPNLATEN